MAAKSQLQLLQVGRALAAIAVVVHHAELTANAFAASSTRWFDWGAYGVDFFFVLSGFIIFWVHGSDPRTRSAALTYAGKRLKRIYVPYLPVGLALMAGYLLFPGLSQGDRDWGMLTSITLLPDERPPALSVAWTLRYEIMFYALFLVFHWCGRFWLWVSVWGLVICWGLFFPESLRAENAFLAHGMSQLCMEFILGMLVARFVQAAPRWVSLPSLLAGACVLAGYAWHDGAPRLVLGIGLSLIVLGLARFELTRVLSVPRSVLFLGAASYSIYLVHNPVQSLAVRVLPDVGDGWLLLFSGCVVIGTLAGCAYHAMLERPVLRMLDKRGRSGRPSGVPAASN